MTIEWKVHRGRTVVLLTAVAAAIAGGVLTMTGGGAAAENRKLEAGWPVPDATSTTETAAVRGADLVVRAEEVRAAEVDLAPAGFSAGDFFHFEEVLYKRGTNRRVGRDAVRCEAGIRSFSCTGTLQLKGRGKLVIDGALLSARDNVFAITGGTGRLGNVGGTLRALDGPGNTSLLALDWRR